jgi:hypothetical protein
MDSRTSDSSRGGAWSGGLATGATRRVAEVAVRVERVERLAFQAPPPLARVPEQIVEINAWRR